MSYYHPTREEAQAKADAMMDSRVAYAKVELEPQNGWVVVIVPKFYDLTEYGDEFEVRDPNGRRLTPRPASHQRYVPAYGARAVGGSKPAPRKEPPATVKLVVQPGPLNIKLPWET